ncbi:MAG: spore coat protein CotJB [Bacilli bacterium]|nr:spore coat protein CotJB [Bacilli bacterium]
MYFDQNNNYFDYSIDNINFNRETQLYSIEEGFNKGNIFKNIYSKYKNHVYKLSVNNEKDKLLYKIQMYTFILKDLNLYLDTHPTDQSILNEYLKNKRILEEYINKYESSYGPLTSLNTTNNDTWTWIKNPWPWDKGGSK